MEVTKNEEPVEREDNSSQKISESEIVCDREDNNSKIPGIFCEEPIAQECEPSKPVAQECEPACEESNSKALEVDTTSEQSIRRAMRTKKIPQWYEDFDLNDSIVDEPSSFQEATTSDAWRSAMQREYDALIKNGTWRLVDPPISAKPIGYKWVYKNKYKADG